MRAVVVAHDPGPWLEETLLSLAAQDYPRLSVMVVDAGSDDDVGARARAVLPEAEVTTLIRNPGFGAAANEILEDDQTPAFYAVCHDDVALRPDAIRLMVEEAIRSNAGIVGPKLVDWEDPRRLRQVGLSIDKTGSVLPLNEPGELDQEQHDAVRDVFAVPGGCQLVRADLMGALDGFDPAISFMGEDVDLCWRAHIAGARVMVVPGAVARHREALSERLDERTSRLSRRHQVRALLSSYGPIHMLRVLPQALLVALAEIMAALFTGRFSAASDILEGWRWNLVRVRALRRKRRSVHKLRQLRDSEVRRFQAGGYAPLTAFVRGHTGDAGLAARGRAFVETLRSGPEQGTVISWVLIAVVLAFGSRHLLTRGLPAVGGLSRFPEGPGALFERWWSGWQDIGLGRAAFAASGDLLLGIGGSALIGSTGLLRTILTVGMIPLGAVGAYRLVRAFGSRRTRLVAAVAYLAVPVAYNGMANGSWSALLLYGTAPWILRRLGAATELAPFGPREGRAGPGYRLPSLPAEMLGLGVILGVLLALAPDAAVASLLLAAGVAVGSLLAGTAVGTLRMLVVTAGAGGIAFVVNLPWSLQFLGPDASWDPVLGPRSTLADDTSFASLLRFDTGPVTNGVAGWAIPVAAALALVIGSQSRLAWAIRGWVLYVGCAAIAWAAAQGWVSVGLPRPEVLLVPGALGVALSTAMGMAAFEVDLRRYRFGWRQLVPISAGLALVVASLPVLGSSLSGRWETPQEDFGAQLAFIDDEEDASWTRVLWIGDADFLPLGSWTLDDDLAFAMSDNATPTVLSRWAGSADADTELVADALDIAQAGSTTRLGQLLGPFGIRYIVIPERLAPEPFGELETVVSPGLLTSLASQLDLERVEIGRGVTVFRNVSWLPTRASVPEEAVTSVGEAGLAAAPQLGIVDVEPALPDADPPTSYSGSLAAGTELYFAAPSSSGWRLDVDGARALRSEALGWANVFSVGTGGDAELRYETPGANRLALVGQVVLWVVVVGAAVGLASATPDSRAVLERRNVRRGNGQAP